MPPAPPPAARPRPVVEPVLVVYQDRLDAATAEGEAPYTRELERPPAGVGAHEIDLARRVLDFIDRHLRNGAGEAVGLRTVCAPVDLNA